MRSFGAVTWNRTLWMLRVSCPLVFFAAIALAYFAWHRELYFVFGVNMFLAGFNIVLSWVQWVIFQPK